MVKNKNNSIGLPSLNTLGRDLLELSLLQKIWTSAKPFLCFGAYFYFALQSNWILAILSVVVLMFVTYVSTSHDYVHGTLKLHPFLNRLLLSVTEMLVLRSGHAFKVCHLNHHRYFPGDKDVEGACIHKSFFGTLLEGPLYVGRLYFWALNHADAQDKKWIRLEGCWFLVFLTVSLVYFDSYPLLFYYFILVQIGSWVYPMFTVYIPHRLNHTHPIFQTRVFRGFVISTLFAHHNYHLEHHLYPMVPHQNWRKLSKRLSPYLEEYNLETIKF